jgi:hypothetical protein
LFQFDKAAGTFTALRYDTTDPGSIFHNRVNAIEEDKEGSLWFATAGGLDRYDFETGTFVHYWNDPVNRYYRDVGTSKHWVTSLCEDEAGILLALLDEEKEASTYELEFSINAADAVLDGALSLSESVYVYHLQAEDFSATKKMTAMICPTQTGQEEGPAC